MQDNSFLHMRLAAFNLPAPSKARQAGGGLSSLVAAAGRVVILNISNTLGFCGLSRRRRRGPAALLMAALFMAAGGPNAGACLIPVFQYALENWSADDYRVVMPPDIGGDQEARAGLELLENAARTGANIKLERSHDAGASEDAPPRLRLLYPANSGIRGGAWEGGLTGDTARALLDSPVRRRIIKHLLDRKVAVWVLLEGGDRRQDRETMQLLEKEVARLKRTLKVLTPEFGEDYGEIQTDIDFAIVRVARDDPAERVLVDMLLGLEPDLRDFKQQPMVFPIYGRGLALYALVGKGINPMTLEDAAAFLTGPCSCQVKSANPGTDLLLHQDWDAVVQQRATVPVTLPTGGVDGFMDRMREAGERLD